MAALEELNLGRNLIKSLPESIFELKKLKMLRISKNVVSTDVVQQLKQKKVQIAII